MESRNNIGQKLKNLVIGQSRSPKDKRIFHKLSLIAFFAWIGLGADGLSSSCYGPQEAFLALGKHPCLAIFVGLGTVLTIFVISASYSQIIELFPTGGGGYLVASKLLSPKLGMISGCALLIDYVLTISVSIASGTDAICSFLPQQWHSYKLVFAMSVVVIMVIMNMRGVKESVVVLTPIFLIFIIMHLFIILYAIFTHIPDAATLATSTKADIHSAVSELGFWGMVFLILRAYGMGAGTFTGIEAVSNGIPLLRDPKVQTAKYTMRYMAISLSVVVLGLIISYLLFELKPQEGKTLNAILFEQITKGWDSDLRTGFIFVILASEAAILFVAAQTGFMDGPRVLANMSLDRWFPNKFSALSDRLVTRNGILIMGISSIVIMFMTKGSVLLLVVLYSINVFITFGLSQLGMVRHWWLSRNSVPTWHKKLFINGLGLALTAFILITMIVVKFDEGGWVTLLITGSLIILALLVKRHYAKTSLLLKRLDDLVNRAEFKDLDTISAADESKPGPQYDPSGRTAVVLVGGFNGTGLHTVFTVMRLFGMTFKNYVFLEIGAIDVGNFKGSQEVDHLFQKVNDDLKRYVRLMNKQGFYAEGISEVSVDVVDEIAQKAPEIMTRFPDAVFFGGQLIFPNESFLLRLLHNQIVFSVQRKLYQYGVPFLILPIRVY